MSKPSAAGNAPAERRIRLRVDHHKCVGSTMCVQVTPGVFALNEVRQADIIDIDGDTPAQIRLAAEECPVSAIVIEDASTGERLFP